MARNNRRHHTTRHPSRDGRSEGRSRDRALPAQRSPRRASSSYDEALRRRGGGLPRFGVPKILLLAFTLLVARLIWLQVIDAPNLARKGENLYQRNVPISAKRGTIYDRNGNVLAMSVESRVICVDPTKVADKATASQILASYLGGDASDYLTVLSQDQRFAYVKKQVDTDVASKILSDFSDRDIVGFYTEKDTKRVYPYGGVAGQVLGFVSEGHGVTGLELYYDELLSGTDGEQHVELGADGTPVAGSAAQIRDAVDGQDIIVSLDANIQQVAETQLTQAVADAEAESGNTVVTDPSTGEILAMASLPLYDPTNPDTLTNEALNLTSVSSSYEPGSTFKILTMAIGYDTGTITPGTVLTVPGKVQVGDDYVTDDDGRTETMNMTIHELMRRSSNAGAAMVGYKIGADKFSEGLAKFGIGSKTGVDYPGEVSGLVTQRADYTGASVGAMAFGQSLAIPSLQLVRAVGAIANKGVLTTPHFLVQKAGETVEWPSGEQAVSEQAASYVTSDMVGVVEEGTGRNAQVEGYRIAGKTGTGEQASAEGGYAEDRFMSSFIGFSDTEDQKVLVYVGVYNTAQHGGTAAAPAFSAIMGEALTDLGIQPNA